MSKCMIPISDNFCSDRKRYICELTMVLIYVFSDFVEMISCNRSPIDFFPIYFIFPEMNVGGCSGLLPFVNGRH